VDSVASSVASAPTTSMEMHANSALLEELEPTVTSSLEVDAQLVVAWFVVDEVTASMELALVLLLSRDLLVNFVHKEGLESTVT